MTDKKQLPMTVSSFLMMFHFLFRSLLVRFRQGKIEAFGCYNPNQLADYLVFTPQKIYAQISTWSRYRLRQVLLKMMVYQVQRNQSSPNQNCSHTI